MREDPIHQMCHEAEASNRLLAQAHHEIPRQRKTHSAELHHTQERIANTTDNTKLYKVHLRRPTELYCTRN
jgi:hypothetical protein